MKATGCDALKAKIETRFNFSNFKNIVRKNCWKFKNSVQRYEAQ